jgi:Tol biopolymer transport system component
VIGPVAALVAAAAVLLSTTWAGAVFPGSNGKIAFSRPERILVMEPDGSAIQRLAVGAADPAWSADGTRVAFSGRRPRGRTDIFVMNADGTGVTPLTRFRPGFNLSPSWSPDGAWIVFRHNGPEGDDLYLVRSDGSELTRLTTSPRIIESTPAWSPDGTLIAFSRLGPGGGYRLRSEELFVMNADGSGITRMTDNHVRDFQPSWSPDAARITFVRQTAAFGAKAFVMQADGTGATRLTSDGFEEFWPSFSPDGSRLVLARCLELSCDLYLMDPDGTDPVQLTNGPKLESHPVWQALMGLVAQASYPDPNSAGERIGIPR